MQCWNEDNDACEQQAERSWVSLHYEKHGTLPTVLDLITRECGRINDEEAKTMHPTEAFAHRMRNECLRSAYYNEMDAIENKHKKQVVQMEKWLCKKNLKIKRLNVALKERDEKIDRIMTGRYPMDQLEPVEEVLDDCKNHHCDCTEHDEDGNAYVGCKCFINDY